MGKIFSNEGKKEIRKQEETKKKKQKKEKEVKRNI